MFFQALNDSRLCDKSNINIWQEDISTRLQILLRVPFCCYHVRCDAREGVVWIGSIILMTPFQWINCFDVLCKI